MRARWWWVGASALLILSGPLAGCETEKEDRGRTQGRLGKFLDEFEASDAKGEPHPDDATGRCDELCEGLRTCVNEACDVTVPASQCDILCGVRETLERPACERITAATAASPSLCAAAGAIIATDAEPSESGAPLGGASPPDAGPEGGADPELVCGRFCSCTIEALSSEGVTQCAQSACPGEEAVCLGCYNSDPTCPYETLPPCVAVCVCVKACGDSVPCQDNCTRDPQVCAGSPAECEACRASEPLCR